MRTIQRKNLGLPGTHIAFQSCVISAALNNLNIKLDTMMIKHNHML